MSFNQPLNDWNVSNVEYMNSMFAGATSFNQPLNNWNVSSLSWHDNEVFLDFNGYMASSTNMESMFQGAISFNQPLHAPTSDASAGIMTRLLDAFHAGRRKIRGVF